MLEALRTTTLANDETFLPLCRELNLQSRGYQADSRLNEKYRIGTFPRNP
jgi:hypothetical protein